ncbi:MAG: TlpA family protein disulfide reductase [Polaromonas sp.]|nr:TlpA family protein disulfide reductase [Polaromonas sp.]
MRASFFFRHLLALALALALPHAPVWAAPRGDKPLLQGRTLAGEPFSLAALRGKVTLVVFWSTDGAVCRDKMPELRANAQGWRGQPFELITVSMDRTLQDTADYERLVRTVVNKKERLLTLWAGDPAYRSSLARPAHLPAAYLLDKSGRVVAQYQGRSPPEAWDRIADLL